jgi:hypothetical protein
MGDSINHALMLQLKASSISWDASADKNLGDGMMPTLPRSKRSASQQLCMVGLVDTSPPE